MNNYNTIDNRRMLRIAILYLDISLIFIFIYSLLVFCEILPSFNNYNVTLFSIIAVFITLIVFLKSGNRFGLSAALLAYTIATQFGMSTIYYLLGPEYLHSFSTITLMFLTSPQYERGVLLGIIAIISYVYGSRVGLMFKKTEKDNFEIMETKHENKIVFISGCMMLIVVFLYLLFYILNGKIYPGMLYGSYLNSGIVNSYYSWIILIYAIGICFIVSVGNRMQTQIGFFIFLLSAIIFLSTGNRGEVLYAVLGIFGILYYRNEKIKFKYILMVFTILFLIIPFIRVSRHIGTISSFDWLSLDFVEPFAEMGHQLRLSVLILEDFVYGSREMLLGYSYYEPMVNIMDRLIPGNLRLQPPEDFNFIEAFSGLGFSQIAESYANFGLLGVILFYFLLGFIFRKAEVKQLNGINLAFWGAVLAILINATRNRFAFVPGSIIIVLFLTIGIKLIAHKKINIRWRKF